MPDIFLDHNPLDRLAFLDGIPESGLEFLARQNPRPAWLVLRGMSSKYGKHWPWAELSEGEWADEMRFNSGSLIAVLLRHPKTASEGNFVKVFEPFDRAYRAIALRKSWVFPFLKAKSNLRLVERIMAGTNGALVELEDAFVAWATSNRQQVVDAVSDILVAGPESSWGSGNAKSDLDREAPAWRHAAANAPMLG